MPVLEDWELALDADKVLWGQGAAPAVIRARRPKLAERAERAITEGRHLLAPAVLYERFPVRELRHERLFLGNASTGLPDGDGGSLGGPLIARRLGPAEEILVAVCTVGSALSEHASERFASDPVGALALDGLASAAAETLAETACRRFEAMAAREGLKASIPLNPGMVGWPLLEGQQQIFALLDAGRIGVSLTPSGLMKPLKSLSLAIGLGREIDPDGAACDFCSMRETCRYRDHG